MKIWHGFGSEHSANLVIIGEFRSAADAQQALNLLNEAADVARQEESSGSLEAGSVRTDFSDAIMDLFKRTNLSLNYGDPEELLYEFHARQEGERVVITTDERDIGVFMKVLLHGQARIEVYSAHSHDGPHGRQART
mgnify:CR=1 FL=1